ncbi:unnamed protein product [Malus baccata var. baccata]
MWQFFYAFKNNYLKKSYKKIIKKKPNQTQKNPSIPCNPSPLSFFLSHSTKPTLQFPFNPLTLTLTHCVTHIRPLTIVKAPKKIEKLVTDISSLTLKEASILVDDLQDKLDVSIAALTPAATEKTEFDVVIEEVLSNVRIVVIKAVKALRK